MNKPLVSVVVISYNHEPYIKECLDGIISQKTNFPIEILVNDDCSTDNTAIIIKEYENEYPTIFRCLYQTENLYSKGIHPWFDILFPIARGKYIALCEGDDYWIDPYKLQKQVDFLETHKEYGFIGATCLIRQENTISKEKNIYLNNPHKIEDKYELYENVFKNFAIYGPPTRTVSLLFLRDLLNDEKPIGDYTLQAVLAYKSKFAMLNEECCIYRRHSTGVSNAQDDKSRIAYTKWFINQKKFLNQRFPNECNFNHDELNDILYYLKLTIAIRDFKYKEAFKFKNSIKSIKYRNKFFYKYFNAISFTILHLLIKLKK